MPFDPRTGLTPGRKRGSLNKLTRERREFVEMVVGEQDSKERKEFADRVRQQFMDGTLSPAIATTILHWWLGKPKDTVEIQTPPQYDAMTNEQLAERARLLATIIAAEQAVPQGQVVDAEVTPSVPQIAESASPEQTEQTDERTNDDVSTVAA
jgi:hypothetical protein